MVVTLQRSGRGRVWCAVEAAVACASGMGATTALLFGLFERGDLVVAARDLYGTTAAFLSDEGRRLGIATDFVDATDAPAILAALRDSDYSPKKHARCAPHKYEQCTLTSTGSTP